MAAKMFAMVIGLAGAATFSQFPEFSQQYLQRLGGSVNELRKAVASCEADAAESGLTCAEAIKQMQGTDFLEARQESMRETIARFQQQEKNLTMLELSSPIERLWQPYRFTDTETLRGTWQVYRPAMPLTLDGLLAALIGFVFGFAVTFAAVAVGSTVTRVRVH